MQFLSFNKYIKNKDNRLLLINIFGNYLIKGGAMIVLILIMPAYIKYFKSESALGMWFTITQLLNWIMLLDFGIGSGIRNKIIEPLQNKDYKRVVELISSTYIFTAILVILLTVISILLVDKINWMAILGVDSTELTSKQLNEIVLVLILGVVFRFFSVIVSQILYALQKAILPSLLILVSNILILFYLYFSVPNGTNDILKLAYVNSLANNLPAVFVTVWLFKRVLIGLGPQLKKFSLKTALDIISLGGVLFYVQIIFMFLFNVKELYITWFVGSAAVVEYQIYYKLIGIIGGLYALALNPVWSAVTKAMAEGNREWVNKLYKKAIYVIVLFGFGQLLLVFFMPWIVNIWLKGYAVSVSTTNGLYFAIYNLIYMWMMLNYNFACGLGRINVMAIWVTIATVLNYVLTVYISQMLQSWVAVIIATAIVSAPCALAVQLDIKKFMTNKGTK